VDGAPLPAYDRVSTPGPCVYPRGLTMSKILPLLAGLLLAVPSLYADEAEDKAVAAVKKLGGKVKRDDKDPAHPVVGVDLSRIKLTVEDMKELAALKNLQTLILWDTQVTDAGLKDLAALKNLQALNLGATQVTDAGLKELANFKELQTLALSHTEVTDAGLKELANLKELKTLDLSETKVTDTGVAELKKALPKCKIIR
jgi:internalin A